ncbi:MAG TPA: hypothetical protein V6C52_03580 [Coleofasciculaceae cyanobacterium]|jgi:hypothetical protein
MDIARSRLGSFGMPPSFSSSPPKLDSGLQDPTFDRAIAQALDAAFGANPQNRQAMPGPIAHLMDALQEDFSRAGLSGLGQLLPQGGMSQRPPPIDNLANPFQGLDITSLVPTRSTSLPFNRPSNGRTLQALSPGPAFLSPNCMNHWSQLALQTLGMMACLLGSLISPLSGNNANHFRQ